MKVKFLIISFMACAAIFAAEPSTLPQVPTPSNTASPIAQFRELLAKSPEQRKIALAARPEHSRKILEKKIEEYSALSPDECERRLAATELQWYLRPLFNLPVADRAAAIAAIPPLWQPHVMQRLSEWDKLSPELQKESLANRMVVEYLSTPEPQQAAILRDLSDAQRNEFKARIARFNSLTAEQRSELDERLNTFFNMSLDKQRQALNRVDDAERAKMKVTLEAFRSLPAPQREICIRSFSKLANMAPEEQIVFLKNIDRWQAMSPQDRQMWRQVVAIVPPMPAPPAPIPPLPTPQ